MKSTLRACTLPSAQAASQKSTHRRAAKNDSACLADRRRIADVIDRYESMSPQMRQTAKRLRAQCLPTYSDPSYWATWPNGS